MSKAITIPVPSSAILPANNSYENRVEVKSESSGNIYIVSQSLSGRWWACSCPGWVRHKHCKHLKAMGLPGNYQAYEAKLLPTKR